MIVHRGLYFGGFDTIKDRMAENSEAEVPLWKRWVVAQAVTPSVGLLSYPLDTVRRRMMMQSKLIIDTHEEEDSPLMTIDFGLSMFFRPETEKEIFDEVLHGDIDFELNPWPKISQGAKDLVRRMLARDAKKRLTTHEVLCELSFIFTSVFKIWLAIIVMVNIVVKCYNLYTYLKN